MKITILGAGIAGLTTAIALKKIGIETEVFEASMEVEPDGAGLGLSANAIKAFQKIGIAEEVVEAGRQLPFFSFYTQKGKLLSRIDFNPISKKYGIDNFTIYRKSLHQVLLSKLESNSINTGKKAIDFERDGTKIHVKFQDGFIHTTNYLIVADGIYSKIRSKLLPKVQLRYAGYACWRGVIHAENIQLNEASETLGSMGRFGIVPLADNQIYWYACAKSLPRNLEMRLSKVEDVLMRFQNYHQPIPDIILKTRNNSLIFNDIYDMPPISQYAFDNILLVGDAAHATTPNMGQGACQAIEDAVIIADELSIGDEVAFAFKRFENRRLNRTHFIIKQSRKIGAIAQIQNPLLGYFRNILMRTLPDRMREKQLEKLYNVDF